MSETKLPFAGTGAVVTGASSGIGRAIAVTLAKAGASRILIHYRENESGAKQTAELINRIGCESHCHPADLSDSSDVAHLVDHAWRSIGPVQTWVNNAGADVLTGDAADWDFETKLRRLIEVDVVGTILLSRLVASRMREQALASPPSIVFIGWDQSNRGMEGEAGQMFAPIKAAVAAFAASLSQEHTSNIRVNTVAPGWIRTSWGESTSEYWDRRAKAQSLMGRWGKPEDVAQAVLYVTDPSNDFIQGQTINVNGGWNRRF